MDNQKNLEAQLLGDMTYDDPRKHQPQGGPDPRLAGASAPLLDDMGGDTRPQPQQSRYVRLTDEQIAILQQQRAAAGQPPFTPEEIEGLQQDYIERQRAQAQQAAAAAQAAAQKAAAASLLQEEPETYVSEKPKHEELRQVDASALLEEAPPEPERKVVFNQEDLEAAKKQAVKAAATSLETGPQSEEEQRRARQQMEQLRVQRLADLAQAGFKVSIIMTIIGVIAGACMAFFSLRPYPEDFESTGFFAIADKFYLFGGVALVALAITIVLRVQQCKGLTSFLFGLSAFLLIIPGCVLLGKKSGTEGFGATVAIFVVAIVCCLVVTVSLSISDKLNAYYGRKDYMND